MNLGLLNVLEFEVALGQTRLSFHFLEFQRVLVIFLFDSLLDLLDHFIFNRLLKLLKVLFLILHTSFKMPL